jgi:hypothetical protein
LERVSDLPRNSQLENQLRSRAWVRSDLEMLRRRLFFSQSRREQHPSMRAFAPSGRERSSVYSDAFTDKTPAASSL